LGLTVKFINAIEEYIGHDTLGKRRDVLSDWHDYQKKYFYHSRISEHPF
jgi:hypothetical protein